MQILTMPQGSPVWHQHRATALNASDAPAMLGISPYRSRADFVRERATGIAPDVTPAQQRIFDRGHAIEALARPRAEKIIGEDLSPCVGKSGKFSASFDGITFAGDVAWECKSDNAALREAMPHAVCDDSYGECLPGHYRAQLEHQAMVSGCERILFTAASLSAGGDALGEVRHCWYTPDPEMRARLIAGWEQFERDVAAYAPTEAAAPVVAAPVESLPAVVVQVDGALSVRGNLPAFGDALRTFIARIPQRPATDQQFADADAACKRLKEAEQALDTAEAGALAQITDVEQMRRAVADLKALARATRLATEKLVAAEKEKRREALVLQAYTGLVEHLGQPNAQLHAHGAGQILEPAPASLAACIKGLKSLDSMQDKLTAELMAQRLHFDALAQRMLANRAALRREDGDRIFLFADFAAVGGKEPEDFAALAELRITQFQQQEKMKAKEAPTLGNQAPAAIKTEADDGTRMTLGQINGLLAPISLSAAGLAELGFGPVATVKAAKLYRESDYPAICRAISEHALAAASAQEVAA